MIREHSKLPLGRTVCFLFLESHQTSVTGIETAPGTVELFSRRRAEPYREIDLELKDGEVFLDAVAPHGANWIVCMLSNRDRMRVCRLVSLGKRPRIVDVSPVRNWRVTDLVGPSAQVNRFLAIVCRHRTDAEAPPGSIFADYSIALVGRKASDFKLLAENIDTRFRRV